MIFPELELKVKIYAAIDIPKMVYSFSFRNFAKLDLKTEIFINYHA